MTDNSQGPQGPPGIQGLPGVPGVDASIASQLSAVNVTMQFLMRDIHAMQNEFANIQRRTEEREKRTEERETRTDDRVARIEQAVEKLLTWQQQSLDSVNQKRARHSAVANLVIAGWAVALLGALGWLIETVSSHLQWHP